MEDGYNFFFHLVTLPWRCAVHNGEAIISVESDVGFAEFWDEGGENIGSDEFAYFGSVVTSHGYIKHVVGVFLGPC